MSTIFRKRFVVSPFSKIIKAVVVVCAGLFLLELAMHWVGASPAAFARPSEVMRAVPWFTLPSGGLGDVGATAYRTCWAFLLALGIGSPFGFIIAKSRHFRTEGTFVLDFLRSIPATALVPLFLVIFGIDSLSKIAVGAFTGALTIAVSVLVGFDGLNRERARAANQIDLRGLRRVVYYELPEIAPSYFVGLRGAASLCLILVIVAEMFIGSKDGLGKVIMDRRYSDDVPGLYAAIVIAGFVGYLINYLLSAAAVRVTAKISGRGRPGSEPI